MVQRIDQTKTKTNDMYAYKARPIFARTAVTDVASVDAVNGIRSQTLHAYQTAARHMI